MHTGKSPGWSLHKNARNGLTTSDMWASRGAYCTTGHRPRQREKDEAGRALSQPRTSGKHTDTVGAKGKARKGKVHNLHIDALRQAAP